MSHFVFIKVSEIRTAAIVLCVLLLLAALVSVIIGVELLPSGRYQMPASASSVNIRGTPAASRTWPSATPHDTAWPTPDSWDRERTLALWHYDVRATPSGQSNRQFIMDLWQAGWPVPVVERKHMWWDWDDPALAGPAPDPATEILYIGLLVDTLVLGGGLWLLIFGPLAVWVLGRRLARTLRGHCTFCGYDMTGLKQCPECGWVPKMRMVAAES